MANPWEKIELSDYENHMSLESVYQLQVLNQMMGEQFLPNGKKFVRLDYIVP